MKRIDIQFRQRKQFARFPLSQDDLRIRDYTVAISFRFSTEFYVIRISVSENRNNRSRNVLRNLYLIFFFDHKFAIINAHFLRYVT